MATCFTKIGDLLFGSIVGPYRQQTRAYAVFALATWERHMRGDEPEPPDTLKEIAEFIVQEDERVGINNEQTEAARELLRVLELDNDE